MSIRINPKISVPSIAPTVRSPTTSVPSGPPSTVNYEDHIDNDSAHNVEATMTSTSSALSPSDDDDMLVSFMDFNPDHFSCLDPKSKPIPVEPGQPPQSYYQIPLNYSYIRKGKEEITDVMFEGCEMFSSGGIMTTVDNKERKDKDGKPLVGKDGKPLPPMKSYTIMAKISSNAEDGKMCMDSIDALHRKCCEFVFTHRKTVNLQDFSKLHPGASFKNPCFRQRDDDGNVIPGFAGTMFIKLLSRGTGAMATRTLFTNLDGEAIPWELLENVDMKFIPLLHFERIYVGGGKAVLQFKMVSAVVLDIKQRNSASMQSKTIARVREANPSNVDQLRAQLSRLTTDRSSQLSMNPTFSSSKGQAPVHTGAGHDGLVVTSSASAFHAGGGATADALDGITEYS